MDQTSTQFVANFHHLEGVTISEKYRCLENLFKKFRDLLNDEYYVNEILENLAPTTYLEKIFMVEFFIFTQKFEELISILKSGNEVLISKIIKNKWFMKNMLGKSNPEEFVKEVLPNLSYSMRCKVLKQLSQVLEEDELDILFSAVKNKYGLPNSLTLLPRCSRSFVEETLKSYPVFLTNGQLLRLIDKDAKLFLLYLQEYEKHKGSYCFLNNKALLNYIFVKDYSIFTKIIKDYNLNVTLGRRITKSFIKSEKEEIISNPKKYAKLLKMDALVRKTGELGVFKDFFSKLLPPIIDLFKYKNVQMYVQKYPKLRRFQLIENSFKVKYNVSLLTDCVDKIDDFMIDMVVDKSKLEMIIEKKISKSYDIKYIAYKDTSESIPLYKKEINLTKSLQKRVELINLMVKSCSINDDYKMLLDILKYVNARHRNDVKLISVCLRSALNNFNTGSFSEELWNLLFELTKVLVLVNKSILIYSEVFDALLLYYEFLYKNCKLNLDRFMFFMKTVKIFQFRSKLFNEKLHNICKKHSAKFLKTCILYYAESTSVLIVVEDEKYEFLNLLSIINWWNSKYSNYKLNVEDFPELLTGVLDYVKTGDNYFTDLPEIMRSCSMQNKFINEIVNSYFRNYTPGYKLDNILLYLIRNKPELFSEYLKDIMFHLFARYHKNWNWHEFVLISRLLREIKKYDHLRLPEKVVELCKEKLSYNYEYKERVFIVLSILMDEQDYISLTEQYKPDSLINENFEEDKCKREFELRCQIVKSFKNMSAAVLPHVAYYLGGDYLQSSLTPLYKLSSHVPMNAFCKLTKKLLEGSVSVRKHCLFLTHTYSDLKNITEVFEKIATTEKNSTIQKRFILTSLLCLKRFALVQFWEYFHKYTTIFLDKNDSETIEILTKQTCIPTRYRAQYYEFIWDILQNMNYNKIRKHELKRFLLDSLSNDVMNLSETFCLNVIEDMFLNIAPDINHSSPEFNKFLARLLFYRKDYFEGKNFGDKMIDVEKKVSKDSPAKIIRIQNELSAFCNEFVNIYINNINEIDGNNAGQFKGMHYVLCHLMLSKENLETSAFLHFLWIIINWPDIGIADYASEVSTYLEYLYEDNGNGLLFVNMIIIELIKVLRWFSKALDQDFVVIKMDFVKQFLLVKCSEENYCICIKILKTCYNVRESRQYKELVQIIKDSPFKSIRILCHHSLKV